MYGRKKASAGGWLATRCGLDCLVYRRIGVCALVVLCVLQAQRSDNLPRQFNLVPALMAHEEVNFYGVDLVASEPAEYVLIYRGRGDVRHTEEIGGSSGAL